MTDSAGRERVEVLLRVSQQVVDGIISMLPVRVFWKDVRLAYLGCNPLFALDAGLAGPQDVIGKDDFEMAWRDQAEAYRRDDRQVIESGRPVGPIEEPQTAPDGSSRWLLTSKVPLRGAAGEIIGVLGTYMDVTERRREQAALVASEMRYRRLFESAKDGILILDAETGMIVDVNPFLVELLGYSRETFLGRKVWELGFFHDIMANEAIFAELQRTGYVRYEDKALEASDGHRVEVEFVSNVYLVDHQRVIQCNVRDVTERKRAQALGRARLLELQRWQDVMLGREDRVRELKREVNELCRRAGTSARYPSQEGVPEGPGPVRLDA